MSHCQRAPTVASLSDLAPIGWKDELASDHPTPLLLLLLEDCYPFLSCMLRSK
jgi:hypothetical protein